ncbi:MAG TPA: Asp-tRNA(Asn)/Glu-tRNA(Gln) amidotransferase subunit GatC [Paenalcaligenes sp.]|nr:Asp-tRNA(Asn)/Glu-tRNA(Gln) amidotransferase subunit GatC [Paenalcaligenes sp.]
MTVTKQEVAHIAELAQLELDDAQSEQAKNDFSHILTLIKQLETVDTTGVTALISPLTAMSDASLRLRDDVPAPRSTAAQREALMANAPAQEDGLFLVPTVIE